MSEMASLRATVHGRVQGVFFRDSTRRFAEEHHLAGYARNTADTTVVEVVAEGDRKRLEAMVDFLRQGPPAARVDSVDIEWADYTGRFAGFSTRS
jgi:acylphosphatase